MKYTENQLKEVWKLHLKWLDYLEGGVLASKEQLALIRNEGILK